MATGTGLAPLRAIRSLLAADPFGALQKRVNRLFEQSFGPLPFPTEEALSAIGWAPYCDVYETDGEIVVKAELPGLKNEDVKVSFEQGILTITGERKFAEETKRENYIRIERSYGNFSRRFALPDSVDPNKMNAEFKDGLLQVTLQKTEEAKPKQIEIKVK
jgi:HSP20 family protein